MVIQKRDDDSLDQYIIVREVESGWSGINFEEFVYVLDIEYKGRRMN